MRRAKRYEEGGEVREGQNSNIDDDTRARAMKWLKQQQESESEVAPKPKARKESLSKTDTGDEGDRLSRRYAAPKSESKSAPAYKKGKPDDIPGSSPSDWKGGSGERADSTELGRNLSAAMNAMGPGRIATGLTLAARERMVDNAAQRAYNARAAVRRAEEGLNATESAAAKQAMREKKTLNPLAWMSGPKGMSENFKKGGVVKTSSASRRGDGIASKGKTRGRMV